MKKILSLVLVLALAVSMAACTPANNQGDNGGSTEAKGPESALVAMQTIWDKYSEEKFFAAGGDTNNMVDGAPGTVDLKNTDFVTYNLLVPEAEQANITEAASLMHAMNANSFTGAVYKVSDAKAFGNAMKTAIMGNQWMCGFPDTLLIASLGGGYVLVAYGINDAMTPFKTAMEASFPEAEILVNDAITG